MTKRMTTAKTLKRHGLRAGDEIDGGDHILIVRRRLINGKGAESGDWWVATKWYGPDEETVDTLVRWTGEALEEWS